MASCGFLCCEQPHPVVVVVVEEIDQGQKQQRTGNTQVVEEEEEKKKKKAREKHTQLFSLGRTKSTKRLPEIKGRKKLTNVFV